MRFRIKLLNFIIFKYTFDKKYCENVFKVILSIYDSNIDLQWNIVLLYSGNLKRKNLVVSGKFNYWWLEWNFSKYLKNRSVIFRTLMTRSPGPPHYSV